MYIKKKKMSIELSRDERLDVTMRMVSKMLTWDITTDEDARILQIHIATIIRILVEKCSVALPNTKEALEPLLLTHEKYKALLNNQYAWRGWTIKVVNQLLAKYSDIVLLNQQHHDTDQIRLDLASMMKSLKRHFGLRLTDLSLSKGLLDIVSQ